MNLIAWFEQEFAALLAHFKHHHSNGTVPNGSVVAPAPPAESPAPAPVVTPAPPAPPAPAALPPGVIEFYPGSDQIAKYAKVEAFRALHAGDPIISRMSSWFILNGMPHNGFEAEANLRNGFRSLAGDTGVRDPKRYDASHFNQAFHAIPNNNPDGTPIGFGYSIGEQYPDVLSAIGDNIGQGGAVEYRGIREEDLDTVLANCLADLTAARARGEQEIQLIGYFPIISHVPAAVAP